MFHSYDANKAGWNLKQNLPDIGEHAALWEEMLKVKLTLPEPDTKPELDAWLSTMEGKIVLFHPQGNTGAGAKNLNQDVQHDFIRQFLNTTDATLVLLDWDNRLAKVNNRRVRHLTDDFRSLNLVELAYVIGKASLLIGVDSGPLHLTRVTDTPSIGVWVQHHPARFALPRDKTAHLVPGTPKDRTANRYHRTTYNLIECDQGVTGPDIAKATRRALAGKIGPELALAALVDRLATSTGRDDAKDRNRSFAEALGHLATKLRPQVIETGCIRAEDDWGAGFFGYVVGWFLKEHGGALDSVDITKQHLDFARKWCAPFPVTLHQSDSVKFLAEWAGRKIDLAYLDSLDTDAPGHAEHCLNEAKAVLPHLTEDALILIDDTPYRSGKWTGKGTLAVPYLLANGFRLKYAGYQVLLERTGDVTERPKLVPKAEVEVVKEPEKVVTQSVKAEPQKTACTSFQKLKV